MNVLPQVSFAEIGLQLLKPEFQKLFGNKQRAMIFDQVEQLIQTYSSVEFSTSEKFTPRQHASFLSSLLATHRKGLPPGTLSAWQSGTTASPPPSRPSSRGPESRRAVPSTGTEHPEHEEQLPSDQNDEVPMSFDDELLGALEVFKDPGYWQSMMMPGYACRRLCSDFAHPDFQAHMGWRKPTTQASDRRSSWRIWEWHWHKLKV